MTVQGSKIDSTCTRPRCERIGPLRRFILEIINTSTHPEELACLLEVLAACHSRAMAASIPRRHSDQWLNPDEAALRTGLTRRWLIEHVSEIGGVVWPNHRQPRFSKKELDAWMRQQQR
jgi:hypothetical protein